MKRPAPTKTPASTIEALMWGLRCGLKVVEDQWTKERLLMCDRAAIEEIKRRLLNMAELSKGARPNWSAEAVAKVFTAWESVHNEL